MAVKNHESQTTMYRQQSDGVCDCLRLRRRRVICRTSYAGADTNLRAIDVELLADRLEGAKMGEYIPHKEMHENLKLLPWPFCGSEEIVYVKI